MLGSHQIQNSEWYPSPIDAGDHVGGSSVGLAVVGRAIPIDDDTGISLGDATDHAISLSDIVRISEGPPVGIGSGIGVHRGVSEIAARESTVDADCE